ncbi:unnamed protein product [marine sediment metagenome]|uniref:FlgD/Vpr Ig-like domain-containing protein n=1 Tax=marine sediment metagenome TaxID=412755 RepID=X1BNV8_9ZZZZ
MSKKWFLLMLAVLVARLSTPSLWACDPNEKIQKINSSAPTTVGDNVSLKIYNINGELVRTLVDKAQASGDYMVKWDGREHGRQEVSKRGLFLWAEIG